MKDSLVFKQAFYNNLLIWYIKNNNYKIQAQITKFSIALVTKFWIKYHVLRNTAKEYYKNDTIIGVYNIFLK